MEQIKYNDTGANPALRKFNPSRTDIERICRFFSIGELKYFEKEKDVAFSHENPFIYVQTTHGVYALKCYPAGTAKAITVENAVSRFLIHHDFPTPVMYIGHDGHPFLTSMGRLVTCFSYIKGVPAWQRINHRSTISQINATMLSLKNILSLAGGRIPLVKEKNLATTILALIQNFKALGPYPKGMIGASLLEAYRTYHNHQPLFIRQWIHNDANFSNFLFYKETLYTLDLFHVREDYALSDLACMVFSCLFLDNPAATVKSMVNDYFAKHKISLNHFLVLDTLIKIKMIKHCLWNIQLGQPVGLATESITALLKKTNNISRSLSRDIK
ncbi:MAG: phosphotransferase [Candidatus Omnitrophota bacterium]|nr:phosphotransferase [Candidatus Omnitrophota bacterium]